MSLLAIRLRLCEVCQFADNAGDWQLQGDVYSAMLAEDLAEVADMARSHGSLGAVALADHLAPVAADAEAQTATVEDVLRLCAWPPEAWAEYDEEEQ